MMLWKLDNAFYRIILGCGMMLKIGLWLEYGTLLWMLDSWIMDNAVYTGNALVLDENFGMLNNVWDRRRWCG